MRFLSDILAKAGLIVDGAVTLNNVPNATVDTDKFLVVDSGAVKYRSGTQLLSDIGGAADDAVVHIEGYETVNGQKTFAGGVIFSQIFGNIYSQQATGIGNVSYSQYTVAGASSVDFRVAFVGANYQTAGTDNAASVGYIFSAGSLPQATSGTHPLMASVAIKAFLIGTYGTTVTSYAASLYIESAPTQASLGNYALWIDSGSARLDGDLVLPNLNNSSTNTNKFLVLDNNVVKYRTGSQLLSDLGVMTSTSFKTAYDPDITGSRNGSNTVFTIGENYVSGSPRVFLNGLRLTKGITFDYTETAANEITLNYAPQSGDLLLIDYIKA